MNACFITVFLIIATKEILGKKNLINSEDVQADYIGKKKLYCGLKLWTFKTSSKGGYQLQKPPSRMANKNLI